MEGALEQAIKMVSQLFGNKPAQAPTRLTPEQYRQWQLQALRDATIAQTAYTPQAAAYLRTVPMQTYGYEPQSSIENTRTGGIYNRAALQAPQNSTPTTDGNFSFIPGQQAVGVNVRFLNPQAGGAVNTLRHEFLHSMDTNINQDAYANYPRQGENSADTYGFFQRLQQGDPNAAKSIHELMTGSGIYAPNDETSDKESFAYYGMNGPQVMLNKQMAPEYSSIYTPASKVVNASYFFPSNEQLMSRGVHFPQGGQE